MASLNVQLFGRLSIHRNNEEVVGFGAGKAQELFAYLLVHRDHTYPRETLASLLWDDCSTAQSKQYLRKAIWQLLAALEVRAEATSNRVLLVEPNWVAYDPEADLWLDVAEFEHAIAPVRGIQGRDLTPEAVQSLKKALQLYVGDLLEGWQQDWCLYERERLQNSYLGMLDKLMGYCETHREYEAGLEYGARILGFDRSRERTHRRLMRLHCLVGDRIAALRQFEFCVAALDEELGVSPDRRTQALYHEIRADRIDLLASPFEDSGTLHTATRALLPDVLVRLKLFGAVLADLERQVQQDIRVVEENLGHQR